MLAAIGRLGSSSRVDGRLRKRGREENSQIMNTKEDARLCQT